MEPRPRNSSMSSYSSSSSCSSYYGCASGVSDLELTNDTYGVSKSQTLFDDVKVILCRHDRKLSKLEDDLTFMVRWLHEKFGFTLKLESFSSIPSGLDECVLPEDSVSGVFSDEEDADNDEISTKNTPISDDLSLIDDDTYGSRGQQLEAQNDCDTDQAQNESKSNLRQVKTEIISEIPGSLFGGAKLQVGPPTSSLVDLKALAEKQTAPTPVQSTSVNTSARKEVRSRRATRQTTKGIGNNNDNSQRPSQCDICGKFLKDACTLRQHKQIHLNVRPFSCTEPGCGKSFRRKFHLQTHSLIHQGVKKHQCGYCGRLFLLQKDMVTHERLHTGEKPFHCPECPKSFNIKSHLTIHLRTHSGEKPYKCEVCSKTFSQANSLRIHKKNVHQSNRQPSAPKERRPRQSSKKSSPRGKKLVEKSQTDAQTLARPLPAKLPLYRNQGKVVNYFLNTMPQTATLSPITILQQPIPSTSHQFTIEPISGNSEGNQILIPTSSLNLVPGSGTSIITTAEIVDSPPQIALTRNIIL